MVGTDDRRRYEATATPQHVARSTADVLAPDPTIGVGERCRWPRPAAQGDAPERIGRFDAALTYYAASVAPNGERRACEWLERAGYSPFVPSRIVERRHAGRRSLVRRPVFPGYAFVGKPHHLSWHGILREPGVISLVSTGPKPVVLPPWQMRMLAKADAFEVFDTPKASSEAASKITAGQKVTIAEAMWDGLIGVVMRAPESRRIAVLLDARGKKLKLEVDVDMLRPA